VYQVDRKHAPALGVSLECLTRATMEQTKCYRDVGCDGISVALNQCLMSIASCGMIRASTIDAMDSEVKQKCVPLARCPDGSTPATDGCPVSPVDAGSKQSACSDRLLEVNGDLVPQTCVECVCEALPDAPFICDASCWQLLACAASACPNGAGDAGECIVQGCGALLSSVSDASLFTRQLSGACSTECSALGL
jgi:hypothetical protein